MPYFLASTLSDPTTHKFYFDRGAKGLDSKCRSGQKSGDALMEKTGYAADENWMPRVD